MLYDALLTDTQAYHSIFLEDRDVPVIGMRRPPPTSCQLNLICIDKSCIDNPTDDSYLTGNFPVLPLRTRTRGPAYTLPPLPSNVSDTDVPPDNESYDCIDEIISLFRANVLFRNFEINGPADRMLIYGILFVSECLGKVKPNMAAREAEKALVNVALDHFAIPGDVSFPFNQAFEPPRDRQDAETLRACVIYLLTGGDEN